MSAETTQRFGIALILFGFFVEFSLGTYFSTFNILCVLGFFIAGGGFIAHLYVLGQEPEPDTAEECRLWPSADT